MPLYIALLAYQTALGATLSVNPTGSGDYTRLGAALSAASSGDTIQVAAGSYTGPFDTNGKSLTITGAGVSSTILTAGASQTVLTIDDGETVTVSGLTLYSALQGVEVRGSTARLSGVHVTDHSGRTPGSGAGVYDGGTLTVTGCVFARNEASSTYSGGGIYVSESTLTVSSSTFRDNSAGQGGALYLDDSVATLTDVNLLRNTATSHGGAIRMRYGADVDTTRLSATDNTAGGRGGAISSYQADLSIVDGVFTGNEAGTSGGALHLDQTSSTDVRVTAEITGNTATTTGGGIYADSITLDLTGTLSDNTAGSTSDGGGIYAITADVTLDNVEVARNRAGSGGGIFSFYGGRLNLSNVTLEDNEAGLEGGVSTPGMRSH